MANMKLTSAHCAVSGSDVPGPAWAQSPGLGWALAGSGLPKPKPDPQLRAGPGLGLCPKGVIGGNII